MTVYIIGTGISGLSAAYTLTQAGVPAALYEAAAHTGGRCHSFFDKKLNALIDNGTHLMLGANTALLEMLAHCPTETPLKNIGGQFTFYKKDGASFQINTARPLSLLPHVKTLYPLLCESVMNTPVFQADMMMMLKTALKCFGKKNGQIYLAYPSLTDSVIRPVAAFLKSRNVPFHFGKRLNKIEPQKLLFSDQTELPLTDRDHIILAVDPTNAARLTDCVQSLPCQPIANIHFKTDLSLPNNLPVIGLIGLTGHWVFFKNGVLSVTISAAEKILQRHSADELAARVWQELQALLKTNTPLPLYRTLIEHRATLLQTREINKNRPFATGFASVVLAGDFTATGLPCTIEGGVRSGITAAQAVLKKITES
ncbi:MAG: FAD-dependent oxidoreductase [Alphaproteobacteria bacterium]|nr:FAD-dependent oxidoreductase [Alphaproteobacteria bacterium]